MKWNCHCDQDELTNSNYSIDNNTVQNKEVFIDSHNICTGRNISSCIPPLINYRQQYRVSKPHSLLACAIEKNFSTFLTAIMCYLHDSKNFVNNNRTLDRDIYANRLCKDINEFSEVRKVGNFIKLNYLAVVRNPIDRFVSGFVDKCLREKTWKKFKKRCAGCKTNITCFVDKIYDRMQKYVKSPYKNIDFDDSHFFPQSWRCEFATYISKYRILKLDDEDFFDKILDLLAESEVSDESLVFINKSLPQRTRHSTMDSVERQAVEATIQNSTYLTKKLIQMYYFDFLLFGYPIPKLKSN